MTREIHLDGGEITILKAIGLSGTQMPGKLLLDRAGGMETSELIETLSGLLSLDYVISNLVNVRTIGDVEKAFFRVNPACSKELRAAVNPGQRRQEERKQRERRR